MILQLPDYHDVIEHPMDFATVRKKLGNGSYSTLEQFEVCVYGSNRLDDVAEVHLGCGVSLWGNSKVCFRFCRFNSYGG